MRMRRVGTIVLGGLTAASVVLGLSVQSDAGDPQPPAMAVADDQAAAIFDQAASGASSSEKAAFSDGKITLGEYQAAKGQATACLSGRLGAAADKALGPDMVTVAIVGPELSKDEFELTYSYQLTPSPRLNQDKITESMLAVPDQIMGECERQYSDDIEVAYQVGLLNDEAYVKRIESTVTACLRESKVPVGDGDSARQSLMKVLGPAAAAEESSAADDEPSAADRARDCASESPAIMAAPAS